MSPFQRKNSWCVLLRHSIREFWSCKRATCECVAQEVSSLSHWKGGHLGHTAGISTGSECWAAAVPCQEWMNCHPISNDLLMGEAASAESSACLACSARICVSGSGLGSAVGAGGRQQLGLKACLWELGRRWRTGVGVLGWDTGPVSTGTPSSASAAANCESALCGWWYAGPCVCTCTLTAFQWVLCFYRSQFQDEKVPTLREAVVESMHHNLTIYFDVKGHANQVLLTAGWHLPSHLVYVLCWSQTGPCGTVPSLTWASPGLLHVSPKVVLGSCSLKLAQGLCKCCTQLTALLWNRAKGIPCCAEGGQSLTFSLQPGICNLHYWRQIQMIHH